jgi:hypothetical protein
MREREQLAIEQAAQLEVLDQIESACERARERYYERERESE